VFKTSPLYYPRKTNMKNKKQTAFRAAMDVARNKRLSGWKFRLFERGRLASQSPIIILAPETPPDDPLACSALVTVTHSGAVKSALAGAPDAREPVAYVCGASTLAGDLIDWLFTAGATPAEAVR
jgi:hypothetical protein